MRGLQDLRVLEVLVMGKEEEICPTNGPEGCGAESGFDSRRDEEWRKVRS